MNLYVGMWPRKFTQYCLVQNLLDNRGNIFNQSCGDKYTHTTLAYVYYHDYYALTAYKTQHNYIRLAYCNSLRLVIIFIASDIALAPSSPMELLSRL